MTQENKNKNKPLERTQFVDKAGYGDMNSMNNPKTLQFGNYHL